jgi:hypothetical protein
MFFLEFYDMLSGGALGSLTVGMVTCLMWEHGRPRRLSHGPSQAYSADVERVMAKVGPWWAVRACTCCCGVRAGGERVALKWPGSWRGRTCTCTCTHARMHTRPHALERLRAPCCTISQVWNWLMEPMLFATIGTSIVFKNLPPQTVPKSLLVVCTGAAAGRLVARACALRAAARGAQPSPPSHLAS